MTKLPFGLEVKGARWGFCVPRQETGELYWQPGAQKSPGSGTVWWNFANEAGTPEAEKPVGGVFMAAGAPGSTIKA